jgi:hypothetical protein
LQPVPITVAIVSSTVNRMEELFRLKAFSFAIKPDRVH